MSSIYYTRVRNRASTYLTNKSVTIPDSYLTNESVTIPGSYLTNESVTIPGSYIRNESVTIPGSCLTNESVTIPGSYLTTSRWILLYYFELSVVVFMFIYRLIQIFILQKQPELCNLKHNMKQACKH